MGNAIITQFGCAAAVASALRLFDELVVLSTDASFSISAGQWIDCAIRLDQCATDEEFADRSSQASKLRGRADECRSRARRVAAQALRSAPNFVADDGSVALSRSAAS